MSILSYISAKKEQFRKHIKSHQDARFMKDTAKLEKLRKENAEMEKRKKLSESLAKEKKKHNEMRYAKVREVGKVMKKVMPKPSKNLSSFSLGGGEFGGDPFAASKPKPKMQEKKKKRIVIEL